MLTVLPGFQDAPALDDAARRLSPPHGFRINDMHLIPSREAGDASRCGSGHGF